MNLSRNGMCAILLASQVGMQGLPGVQPLSMTEWADFLSRVIAAGAEPKVVFGDPADWGPRLGYEEVQVQRMQILLARGGAVALELDGYSRKGMDAVTMFDPDYPQLLKRRLKRKSPPVLFYSGNIRLANRTGIGVVGSRDVDADGAAFAADLAEKATREGLAIFSGGARGVDTIAASTAIQHGGCAVAYLADALQVRIKRSGELRAVMDGQLLLFTSGRPEEGFTTPRALTRNSYIYASVPGTFAVSSDYGKGGTWSGATQAIQHRWGKVLVWNHGYRGNQGLIQKGGVPYELSPEPLLDTLARRDNPPAADDFAQMTLFDPPG